MSSKINDSFLITSTNKEEIYQIISCLISNKFCGPNSIPTKRLHLLQDQILNHLATIFDLSNYRPSSLLSNIDKIFEKLMHRRLIEFLEGKQIFYYRHSLGLEKISQQTMPFKLCWKAYRKH